MFLSFKRGLISKNIYPTHYFFLIINYFYFRRSIKISHGKRSIKEHRKLVTKYIVLNAIAERIVQLKIFHFTIIFTTTTLLLIIFILLYLQ